MNFYLLLLLLALTTLSSAAQSPTKILRQAERAMGGAKNLAAVRSMERSGTIMRSGRDGVGKIVIKTARPNQLYVFQDIDGEREVGYNGRSGWIRDSRDGLRTLTGDTSTKLQAQAAFRNTLWLNYKKDKSKITSNGVVNIDGKPANLITLSTTKGVAIKLYFDSLTGLLVRDEVPNAQLIEVTDYSDYRDVKGVKVAFAQRISIDAETFDVRFNDVRINSGVASNDFDFPKLGNEPLPDIRALLIEVQSNEERIEKLVETYSYVQQQIRRELGKDGVLREMGSQTYQLSFYKGYRITRLIEKDGKPLSPDDQQDEDKKAAKRVEEIERKIAKQEDGNNGPPSGDDRRISITEVLRASNLTNPRRERFHGRDVIVFDFEPNPNFDFKNAKSMLKFFGKTAGAIWIDEKDKQVARVEAFLSDSFNIGGGVVAKLKKGAAFTLEQERVNDEVWLPSTAEINLSVRLLLVKGIDVNQLIRSYDYRKFSTEVKDAKVNSVANP